MGLRDSVVHAGEPEVSRAAAPRGAGERSAGRWVNGCSFFFLPQEEEEEEELVVRREAGPGQGLGRPCPGSWRASVAAGEARSLCGHPGVDARCLSAATSKLAGAWAPVAALRWRSKA